MNAIQNFKLKCLKVSLRRRVAPLITRITAVVILVLISRPFTSADAGDPVEVIFDTDITGDVDDVLALAMLHALADRGECEIAAVTISKINPLAASFVDAVNTFYGRPDIPIGVTRDAQRRDSKYLHLIETRNDNALRYPHDLRDGDVAPDAVDVLRQALAEAKNSSMTIIQVGLAANLADLAESPRRPA